MCRRRRSSLAPIMFVFGMAWPVLTRAQSGFVLGSDAVGSAGGFLGSGNLAVGMTVAQSVTGMAGADKTFAETVGFWRWGFLPVLAVPSSRDADPSVFALFQPTPNPSGGTTALRYYVPRSMHVGLRLFDLSGRVALVFLPRKIASGSMSERMHPSRSRSDVNGIPQIWQPR